MTEFHLIGSAPCLLAVAAAVALSACAATRTRPLCPYPAVARYRGSGDIEAAANFVCR